MFSQTPIIQLMPYTHSMGSSHPARQASPANRTVVKTSSKRPQRSQTIINHEVNLVIIQGLTLLEDVKSEKWCLTTASQIINFKQWSRFMVYMSWCVTMNRNSLYTMLVQNSISTDLNHEPWPSHRDLARPEGEWFRDPLLWCAGDGPANGKGAGPSGWWTHGCHTLVGCRLEPYNEGLSKNL